jgi:hypothetical protein
MANSNFIVQNGLTVGTLTIDAATGSINTSGTITSSSTSPTSFSGNIVAGGGTASTSTTTGALVVVGGAGISGSLYVGSATTSTSTSTGALVVTGGAGFGGNVYVGGNLQVSGTTTFINTEVVTATEYANKLIANGGIASTSTTTGDIQATGGAGIGGALYVGGLVNVAGNIVTTSSTDSSSTTTGSLVLAGGLGVAKNMNIAGNITPSANVTYNLGTATANWNNIYAVTFTGTSTTAKYADLAECYTADAVYEPGTVVDFGGTYEVTLSDIDGSNLVAGVITTNPAHLMNSTLDAEFIAAVALTGRVPCKVTGPVRKGQMMVSAGNGRARAELNPKMGSVIGKALEDHSDGDGVIEVVVGRL